MVSDLKKEMKMKILKRKEKKNPGSQIEVAC
jgi:hypothetical protein